MNLTATITEIGPDALNPDDKMLILFDESATDALKTVTVIQRFEQRDQLSGFKFKADQTITINDQTYTITHVGKLADQNFTTIGHVALLFQAAPDVDRLESALYLTPSVMPEIHEGDTIVYHD